MDVYLSTENNKKDIVLAWTVAILIHVLFFSLTGKMFIKPPQFAIAPSREIDINLIDVPKDVVEVKEQAKPVIKQVEEIIPKIEKQKQRVTPKILIKPRQIIRSTGQVKVEAKPDYVQNPPPTYPAFAKQMRQEGIVMLKVDVDKEGNPLSVSIIQSSGFRLLDQAAVKAVRHWKFQPGRIGDLAVESNVTVPIKFRLEQ